MKCDLKALGRTGENYCDVIVAMQPELEPRDAVEAMLIAPMGTTQVAMPWSSQKVIESSS